MLATTECLVCLEVSCACWLSEWLSSVAAGLELLPTACMTGVAGDHEHLLIDWLFSFVLQTVPTLQAWCATLRSTSAPATRARTGVSALTSETASRAPAPRTGPVTCVRHPCWSVYPASVWMGCVICACRIFPPFSFCFYCERDTYTQSAHERERGREREKHTHPHTHTTHPPHPTPPPHTHTHTHARTHTHRFTHTHTHTHAHTHTHTHTQSAHERDRQRESCRKNLSWCETSVTTFWEFFNAFDCSAICFR